MSVLALGVAACGDDDEATGGGGGDLSGSIRIDGSSTVAPLTEAVAEQFESENSGRQGDRRHVGHRRRLRKVLRWRDRRSPTPRARSSPKRSKPARRTASQFEEVRVATDALTVVVNPENPVNCLTVEQLGAIWGPDSKLSNWSEVPGLKEEFDEDLQLFGPGTDSGTFDYFTEEINGEEGASRKDYNNVGENDNATVTGVQGAPGGMGYFGFSFYQENEDTLKALEVDDGKGCVAPSAETAQNDEYMPLSRPLFIYPSAEALEKPEVKAFVDYYLESVNDVAEAVGFIPLTEEQLEASKDATAKLG